MKIEIKIITEINEDKLTLIKERLAEYFDNWPIYRTSDTKIEVISIEDKNIRPD